MLIKFVSTFQGAYIQGLIFGGLIFGGKFVLVIRGLIFGGLIFVISRYLQIKSYRFIVSNIALFQAKVLWIKLFLFLTIFFSGYMINFVVIVLKPSFFKIMSKPINFFHLPARVLLISLRSRLDDVITKDDGIQNSSIIPSGFLSEFGMNWI